MDDQAPKVTRARMIIEKADGSASYYEARDPAGTELSFTWPRPQDASPPRDGSAFRPPPPESVTLAIKGAPPWGMEVFARSGEIPPELAERSMETVDMLLLDGVLTGGPLAELRPYLARIAGRQP